MSGALWLRDLGAYSVQLALLVGAAALLARLFPLRPPSAALGYWQLLLLACLVLPIGQPRQAPEPRGIEARAMNAPAVAPAPAAPAGSAWVRPAWATPEVLLGVLGAGVAARAAWLGLGLLTLAGLRRRARPLGGGLPELARAQRRLGVRAEFFTSDETEVPITFGLARPVVLLPAAVLAMQPQAQQAILCHELLHVRRRDWAYAVVEECVRALLWFHPAVAWLVGRIQLSREQTVDRAVIAVTESREDYVGALLAVARATARPQPVPAPLFLRKGRLKQRVAEILEEGTMSKRRLISHLLTSGCALVLAAGAAMRLVPLEARAAGGDAPVQVLRGGENLLHRAEVEYPRRAIEKGVAGDVLLSLSLDERGQVQDARVISGPDELRAAALRSVLRWHYSPSAGPGTTEALLQFRLPEKGERDAEESAKKEPRPAAERLGRQIEELQKALDDPAVAGERREKYRHLLREREEELQHLKAGLDEIEHGFAAQYASEKAEAELHRMQEKLAWAHAEDQERRSKELTEHARALAEQQQTQEQLHKMEYARAAGHSADLEARLKRIQAEQKHAVELQGVEEDLRKMEYAQAAQHRAKEEARWEAELDQRKMAVKLREARPRLPGRLSAIHAARLAPDALKTLLPQLGVKVGDTLDAAAFERAKAAVASFDEHIEVELGREPEDGGLILLLVGPQP